VHKDRHQSSAGVHPGCHRGLAAGADMKDPRFVNICEQCIFLGQFEEYDLYFCDQNGAGYTVLARWSDESQDYTSGLGSRLKPLVEAERRLEILVSI
jgi:hypothetical protein